MRPGQPMASVCVCSQLVLPTGPGLVVKEPFPAITGILLTCQKVSPLFACGVALRQDCPFLPNGHLSGGGQGPIDARALQVNPNSIAAKDGRIREGDRIIQVRLGDRLSHSEPSLRPGNPPPPCLKPG